LNSFDTLQLTKLNKLYINDNRLSSLDFIATLPALKHLTADNNPSAVPGSMPETLETFSI
jgi:Leucine-rich repeat (LRR) protein